MKAFLEYIQEQLKLDEELERCKIDLISDKDFYLE